MKQKRVWLLSGIPGSGKSTWAQAQLNDESDIWISRDLIRFNMLEDGDEYFSREDEVFDLFIQTINGALNSNFIEDIYVDATHLNDKARHKTLDRLNKENIEKVIHVVFDVPVDVCIERNNLREGRAKVPETVIHNMYKSFKYPNFNGDDLVIINKEGEITSYGNICNF